MPRKAFVADLQDATRNIVLSNVHDVRAGEDDGTFTFTYKQAGVDSSALAIYVHVSGMQILLIR